MYLPRPFIVADGGTGATTAAGAQTNLGVPASTAVMLLSGIQAMTGAMDMGSHQMHNLTDPTSPQDGASKNYVDNAVAGITPNQRTSVRVATTANISNLLTGAPSTLDGVSLAIGDYILVKDQTTQTGNGVYSVTTVGTGANGVWARATGYNLSAEIEPGLYVFVGQGTANAGSVWMLSADEPYTLGTTNLTFIQVNGAFDITAGNGLTKSGNTLSVLASNSTITVAGGGISVAATYPGNTSLVTLGTVTTGTWNGTTIAVLNGGTGATSASSARSNLSAAPNTPSYWVGASNGELGAGIVPSGGTGILLTATTGVITIDTSVVVTLTGSQALTNKIITAAKIREGILAKSSSYTGLAGDESQIVEFTISSGATYTLPASSGLATGSYVWVKNKKGSTANLQVNCAGSDSGENNTFNSSTNYPFPLTPGTMIKFTWDGSEYVGG